MEEPNKQVPEPPVMQVDDLKANPKNPRVIDKPEFEALKKSIREFGDLSAVVFNIKTGQLVGGHQRVEAFKASTGEKKIVYSHRHYNEPDRVGTVASGYVSVDGMKFPYREVNWDESREHSANIAANRIQGRFDVDLLAQVNYELSQLENGAELLALTGQTKSEVDKLLDMVGAKGDGNPEDDEAPPWTLPSLRPANWGRSTAWVRTV